MTIEELKDWDLEQSGRGCVFYTGVDWVALGSIIRQVDSEGDSFLVVMDNDYQRRRVIPYSNIFNSLDGLINYIKKIDDLESRTKMVLSLFELCNEYGKSFRKTPDMLLGLEGWKKKVGSLQFIIKTVGGDA